MKVMMALLKREWLEWQRVIIGAVAVITFLNLLALFSVNRGANHLNRELDEKGHIYIEDVVINDDDGEEESYSFDIRIDDDEVTVEIEGEDHEHWEEGQEKASIGIAYYLRFGLQGIFHLVLFLALFYFADAIYKERSDNSTLFYRSLPVSDHQVLASKIIAGMLGIIGLTYVLSLEFMIVSRLALWILGQPLKPIAVMFWNNIAFGSLLYDWLVYLIVSTTRLLPLALFLMLVSSWVRGRPLIIGIGGPILAGITFAIVFGSAGLLKTIFELFINLNKMISEQWMISDDYTGGSVELFGQFWGYLFTLETLFLLLVSGGMYATVTWLYRRNIPTA